MSSAETAQKFQALEDQAQQLLNVFTAAGYEAVAPSIIQPAEIFLDVVGEDLRARTYVFTDPEGHELCLRPDLTVPTCRLHWERNGRAEAKGRYCYNGPAFRFQPEGGNASHPREFRQAGVECFGASDPAEAEAEVLSLILAGLKSAGLEKYTIRIGDLGIFDKLLNVLNMPERWRERLRSQFWRPAAFRSELETLATRPAPGTENLPGSLLRAVANATHTEAEAIILTHLDENAIEFIGSRSISEITANLKAQAEDISAEPLDSSTREIIHAYLGVSATARAAGARLKDMADAKNIHLSSALVSYEKRLKTFAAKGIDISQLQFHAEFGRNLEYYTGFVFEVHAPGLDERSPVAGGGRYDNLMRTVGATVDVPAVGAMIHTERLLNVVRGASP